MRALCLVLCCFALISLFTAACPAVAAESGRIVLPEPDTKGGMPLMQALAQRRSTRAFKDAPLPLEHVSNLAWAAFGVNRPDGRRTAPTAMNSQAVAVYAVMENGVWLYNEEDHELVQVMGSDERRRFGGWPLTLLFAAPEGPYSGMHVGSLYQNVGLYCASAGLNNVVKATGASALNDALPLPEGYRVFIVQSVGLPE